MKRLFSFTFAAASLLLSSADARVALAQRSTARAEAQVPTLTRPPELLRFVEAVYPPEEIAAGRSANVVLELTIDGTGRVTDASVVESAGAAFDAAALAAARQFEFRPAEFDGQPGAIRIHYQYVFTLPAPPEPVVPDTAILAGVVRDEASGQPLAGVTVAVASPGAEGAAPTTASATTDAEGRFAVEGVVPGRVTVTLSGGPLSSIQTEETLAAGERLEVSYDVALPPPPEEGEPTDDMEIVVVAPEIRREVVASEISAEQATSVPGTGGDVLRVVESLPGVGRPAVGSGQLVVWGASPEDTRVYLDGVPLPRLYHEGGLRSVVHPAFVESLALIPGGAGAPYGRGLGGVVLVEGRGPTEEGFHGTIGADLLDASASLGYRRANGSYQAAAGRFGLLDSFAGFLDDDVTEFVPIPRFWDGQARAGFVLGGGATIDIVGVLGGDRYERGVPNPDPALATRDQRDLDFYRLYARYRRDAGDGTTVEIVPWLGYDRSYRATSFGDLTSSVEARNVRLGLRALYAYRAADWVTLRAGIDAEIVLGDYERQGSLGLPAREGDIRVFGQPPPDTLSFDTWESQQIGVAPWIEARIDTWNERLHITPGLRLDPYARSASRRVPVDATTPELGTFVYDFTVEPRLAADLDVTDWLSVRGSIGRYARLPSSDDVSPVFGNPALPRARGTQILAGVAVHPIPALEIEATGFLTTSEALATRTTDPTPLQARALEALGEGRVKGIQGLVRANLDHGLFGWVAYTLSRAERKDSPDVDWRLFDLDQTHVLTAVAGWTSEFGLELSGRFRFASGFPRTDVIGAYYDAARDRFQPLFGEHNGIRLKSFVQLDLRVGYTAEVGESELVVYLDVQNATNRENVEELIYSPDYTDRRTIRSLPILPVVGLQWRF